ncbi:hypothetical protein BN1708_011022, partial [Verticillium longisporum]
PLAPTDLGIVHCDEEALAAAFLGLLDDLLGDAPVLVDVELHPLDLVLVPTGLLDGSGQPLWTVREVNALPIGAAAVQVVTRNVPLDATNASSFIANTCLAGGNIFMAWLAELLPHEPEVRSLIIGASITAVYAAAAGVMILVWPACKAQYCESQTRPLRGKSRGHRKLICNY